ncbi:MAG: hypothetical protein LUC45_05325 [Paraprevotella sp.]|nr:hypothetical protein [Paraprevotella sp.]
MLFWNETEYNNFNRGALTATPTYVVTAPLGISSYASALYDTQKKYNSSASVYYYSTGYSPTAVLTPTAPSGTGSQSEYAELTYKDNSPTGKAWLGRYDICSTDAWEENYRGSFNDPFGLFSKTLLFRHLTSKLVFYVIRDASMTSKERVRRVTVDHVRTFHQGKEDITNLQSPTTFKWMPFDDNNLKSLVFIDNYTNSIAYLNSQTLGNLKQPEYGYMPIEAQTLPDTVLFTSGLDDPVMADLETPLDSVYVCGDLDRKGGFTTGQGDLYLKMNIQAQFTYASEFPTGYTDDNAQVFYKKWVDQSVPVYGLDGNPINSFLPGYEYRIYIHFYKTGVYLEAKKVKWKEGGTHYVDFGGNTTTTN